MFLLPASTSFRIAYRAASAVSRAFERTSASAHVVAARADPPHDFHVAGASGGTRPRDCSRGRAVHSKRPRDTGESVLESGVTERIDVLVFEVAGARFAVPLDQVREVVRAVAIAPLPGAPPIVEGVIDYRGTTIPVLDLRNRFGLPAREPDPSESMVVARAGDRTVAIRVDHPDWLAAVDPSMVDESAAVTRGLRFVGVARLPDGLALIHDLDGFLVEAEAERLDAALSESETSR
jgi:purine-binding chemotaxis protein CheW